MGPTALALFSTFIAQVFALYNIWPGTSLGNYDDNLTHRDLKQSETLQLREADTFVDCIPISETYWNEFKVLQWRLQEGIADKNNFTPVWAYQVSRKSECDMNECDASKESFYQEVTSAN